MVQQINQAKEVNQPSQIDFGKELTNKIDTARRKCTLSDKMIKMLVKQINHELFNKHVYQTFANYYNINHLPKLCKYYKMRAEEEQHHANWIIKYLNDCDANFSMPKVGEVNIVIKDLEQPFDLTVDLEIYTTQCINEIAVQSLQEVDLTTFNWLNHDSDEAGKLIMEQREEETTSRIIAGLAHQDTDWLTKQDSILEYYENRD